VKAENNLSSRVTGSPRDLINFTESLSGPSSDDRFLKALGSSPGGGSSPGPGAGRTGPFAKAMGEHMATFGGKALTSGSIMVPSLARGVVSSADRPRSILDLIRVERLDGTDSFAFLRETARTHLASTVASGALKPTSTYSVEKVEDRVRVVASLSEPIDKFLLSDSTLLGQYLEGSLRAGVELALEDQILNGAESTTGVLDDMNGILNQDDVGSQTFSTDALTSARKAITQMQALNIDMSGVAWVLNAGTWEDFELVTSDSPYVMGDPGTAGRNPPVDQARMSLWGYPVVISAAVDNDVAVLGDWKGSVVLYQRDQLRVDWSDAPYVGGNTLFQMNQVQFRAEGRWGLAVLRPKAFIPTALTGGG